MYYGLFVVLYKRKHIINCFEDLNFVDNYSYLQHGFKNIHIAIVSNCLCLW